MKPNASAVRCIAPFLPVVAVKSRSVGQIDSRCSTRALATPRRRYPGSTPITRRNPWPWRNAPNVANPTTRTPLRATQHSPAPTASSTEDRASGSSNTLRWTFHTSSRSPGVARSTMRGSTATSSRHRRSPSPRFIEVDADMTSGGSLSRLAGWADVGNLHVAEGLRRRGRQPPIDGVSAGHLLSYRLAGRFPCRGQIPSDPGWTFRMPGRRRIPE